MMLLQVGDCKEFERFLYCCERSRADEAVWICECKCVRLRLVSGNRRLGRG
jgi:hypothetical protein